MLRSLTTVSARLFALGLRTTSGGRARPRRTPRLAIQTLEDRITPVTVGFVTSSSTITEGTPPGPGGSEQLEVKLDQPLQPNQQVSVAYKTVDGTATVADNDYHGLSSYFIFTYGGPTSQYIPVSATADSTPEPDENFSVVLTDPVGATLGTSTHTVTIADDDSGGGGSGTGSVVGRVWADATGTGTQGVQDSSEGGISGITVELHTSGGTLVATTTTGTNGSYAFSSQSAGNYYVQFVKPGSPANAAFTTENVGTDDSVDSDCDSTGKTDTFFLSNGAVQDRDAGLLNVSSNTTGSGGPAVTITKVRNTVEGYTGAKAGEFQVARAGSTSGSLAVQLTFSGRATFGVDYTLSGSAVSGTVVTIPAGSATATVDVLAVDDGVFEDTEDVVATVVAANDGSYTLGSPATAQLLIADSQAPNDFVAEDSDCGCSPTVLAGEPGIGGSGAVAEGGSKARYADGVLSYQDTDLSADGFGSMLTLTRSFANGFGYDAAGYDGNNTVISDLPYLKTDSTGVVFAVTNGAMARFFDPVGGGYAPRHYSQDTLTYDSVADEFTLTDSQGDQVVFFGFGTSRPVTQRGALKNFTAADGSQTTVAGFTTDGKPTALQRSATVNGTTTTEQFAFTYISGGVNDGKVAAVVEQRQVNGGAWTTVRSVADTYYDGTTAGGTAGDLKTAVVKDGGGAVLDTKYARYFTADTTDANGNPIGYAGALKMAFSAASYERFAAWCAANATTVDAATDAQAAVFADAQYQYDEIHRVTQAILQGEGCSTCAGGEGVYGYSYETSQFADGYNAWKFKTTETLPDGNQNIVYANFAGQTILSVYKDTTTGQAWPEYRQYDGQGRLVLEAGAAAVLGYSETTPGLATLNSTGLINTTTYYATTTANDTTAGGVAGYVYQTFVQRGTGGTPILQSTTDYIRRVAGGITVYLVAHQTQYRNSDGTGSETTSYAYTFFTGSIQPQQVTTTLPTVTTGENGPGTATSTTTVYDTHGRVIWEQDAAGFLTYTEYDEATGAVTKTIADVDTTQTGTFANLPSGWSTPSGGGLHETTTYEVDGLGRTTAETDPNGHVTYTVFNDPGHEVRTYAGWNTSTNTPTGPTMVSREDRADGYTETLTMSAAPAVTNGRPDGTEAISGIQSLSRQVVNAAGQVVDSDEYFDLTGVTYSQSAVTLGTAGTNYNRTQTDYDDRGRMDRTVSPAGTITRTVYDGLGRVVSEWVGTNDTPASGEWSPTNNTAPANMVEVAVSEYDSGGVGDGLLTKSTQMPGSPYANRVTQMAYDWRDRQVAVKSGVEASESTTVNRPISYQVMDNLGEVTETDQYDGDGLSITTDANGDGVLDQPSAGALRAKSAAAYDELGRAYQEQTFSVDPSTGVVSANALTTNHWFDARGNEIKTASPGGLVSKTAFDGLGRAVTAYTTDGGGDAGYADAGTVTGDVVLTQAETQYDAAGNALEVTTRDRFHDQPDTATGALGTPTSGVLARVSYQVMYYDLADRPTDSVDVGTNGGTAYTRPGTAPGRSDTALVTSYGYDPAGRQFSVTDPKGLVDETFYDLAGRVTKTIQDFVDGVVSNADDKTTTYTYTADGQQQTLTAWLSPTTYETTENVYGITSPIVSNDILAEVHYPDPSSGNSTSSEKDSYTYDQLGDALTKADRNGNVHAYTYDVLGRQISDAVTTLGTGVDGAVRRIDTAYDGQGNPYLVTSYDAASGGNIVNQVQRNYNGLGQLVGEFQAVSGAVNTSTTPFVAYAYSEMAGGVNNSRLTEVSYPTAVGASGKSVYYDYGTAGGLNDRVSRLNALIDNNGIVAESYQYLGLGTVVERDHPEINVNLTYIKLAGDPNGDAGDQYTGLDRFGRVVDQRWRRVTGTVADLDRRVYTYDRDGNVLYAENASTQAGSAARSEAYTYDGLNQLTSYQRGTLTKDGNGNVTGITSILHHQEWGLDAVGNFNTQATDGSTQTRTHDKQNEILSVSGATTPTYDSNGNLTRQETGDAQVYDAWNRLVQVKTSPTGSSIATYVYDGLGRRVSWTVSSGTRTFYYSDAWQVLEERVGTARDQYVWGVGYVDDLVLRDENADGNSGNGLEQRIYALQDANYNTRALVGAASGLVVERYLYYPYGVVSITDSAYTSRSSSSYNWNILFQGLKWQSAVGLYVGRARAYSPTLGRWLENDPIGFDAGDQNLYRAYANKPVSLRDFSGFDVCFTSISVTDKGSSIAANHGDEGKPYAKLGQKTEPVGSFAHGFQVVVNAEVTPDDDITNADVRQQVVQLTSETSNDNKTFQLSVSAIGSRKYIPRVLLTDFVEAMFIGNEDFWNIDMAQDGALTTAPGGAFRPNLDTALVKTTKDTITYVDFPGSDPAVTSIDPTKFSAFTSLYAFQVIAKNKGKKEGTLKARFWVFLDAKSDGKKWTGTSLMMPPMPQEWTAPK